MLTGNGERDGDSDMWQRPSGSRLEPVSDHARAATPEARAATPEVPNFVIVILRHTVTFIHSLFL